MDSSSDEDEFPALGDLLRSLTVVSEIAPTVSLKAEPSTLTEFSDSSDSFLSARDDFSDTNDPSPSKFTEVTGSDRKFNVRIETLVLSSAPTSDRSNQRPNLSPEHSQPLVNAVRSKQPSCIDILRPSTRLVAGYTTDYANEDSDNSILLIRRVRRSKSPTKIILSDSDDDASETSVENSSKTGASSPRVQPTEENAILRYSPPPKQNRQPTKLQQIPLLPATPSTPRARRERIPKSPFRESSALFWNEEQNSAWIDKHITNPATPRTPLSTLGSNTCESTTRRSPKKSKAELEAARTKKHFLATRAELATSLLSTFINAVHPSLPTLLTGPIEVIWSKTLTTTAGRATYAKSKNTAHIELSSKVIDSEDRLRSTLSHELCHVLVWVVDGQFSNPHGREFKRYGSQFEDALGIRVETTHDYEIDYKYQWACTQCDKIYGRHSKSIDPLKSVCSACRSTLRQVRPMPRPSSPKKQGQKTDGLSRYREFLAANMDRVRSENPGLAYAALVKRVAAEYAVHKAAATTTTTRDLTLQMENLDL